MQQSSSLQSCLLSGGVVLASIAWMVVLVMTADRSIPRFANGVYRIDGGEQRPFDFPLHLPSSGRTVDIDVDIVSPWRYQPTLLVGADDCIVSLRINDKEIRPIDAPFPYCISEPAVFHLPPFMTTDTSHVSMTLDDYGGLAILRMEVSKTDPLISLFWILGIAGLLVSAWILAQVLRLHLSHLGVGIIVIIGSALRLLYVFVTPHDVRSHEWDKHLEYVRYMSEHFSLPHAADGWEFYQPPLYYVLTGAWMRIATMFHWSTEATLFSLQTFSLILSIMTLLVGVAIGYTLFRGSAQKHQRLLFSALLAVFPSFILFSSRITNDALLQFLSFLFVLFLLRFWHGRRLRDAAWQTVTVVLALLTKMSALLFLPVSVLCIVCMRTLSRRRKALLVGTMLMTSLLLAGWLPILRSMEQDTTRSVYFGSHGIDQQVALINTPTHFFVFNPLEVLRHPWNNPYVDRERRQYFLEYFFKSAFFGEFGFPPSFATLGFLILGLGFASLIMALAGMILTVRRAPQEVFPLFPVLFFHVAAVAAYRFLAPFAPAQDFRYVAIIIIPWLAFAIIGAFGLSAPLRRFCTSILWAWAAVCGLFILKIVF